MKYIKLDHTGHTEIDYAADQMIAQLEKDMAGGGVAVMAKAPNGDQRYIRKATDVAELDPNS